MYTVCSRLGLGRIILFAPVWQPQLEEEEQEEVVVAPNPHMPQFLSESPWYLAGSAAGNSSSSSNSSSSHTGSGGGGGGGDGSGGGGLSSAAHDGLSHQRKEQSDRVRDVRKTIMRGEALSTFVAGACRNCGSRTHQQRDCIERPRRRKAAVTGSDLNREDTYVYQAVTDFEAKRDRWRGYDASEHLGVLKARQLDEARMERNAAVQQSQDERARMRSLMGVCDGDDAEWLHVPAGQRVPSVRRMLLQKLEFDRKKWHQEQGQEDQQGDGSPATAPEFQAAPGEHWTRGAQSLSRCA